MHLLDIFENNSIKHIKSVKIESITTEPNGISTPHRSTWRQADIESRDQKYRLNFLFRTVNL